MKVTSSKPKGQRIFKAKHRPYWIEPIEIGWWFNLETGEWQDSSPTNGSCSAYYAMEYDGFNNVWSLKAAKRLISKWNVPKGTWFKVSLPWVGYEFKVRK